MGCSSSTETVAANANAPPTSPILSVVSVSAPTTPNPLRRPPPPSTRRKSAPHPTCVIHPDPALERRADAGRPATAELVQCRVLARKHRSVSPQNFGRVVEEPTPEQQAARAAALAELAAAHGITPDPGQFTAAGPDPAAARRSSVKCAQWIVAHLRHQARPYDPAQDEAEAAAASSAPAP